MLIIFKLNSVSKAFIKLEPTKPAPPVTTNRFFIIIAWQCPTLQVLRLSTIGAERLDFRVRMGSGITFRNNHQRSYRKN